MKNIKNLQVNYNGEPLKEDEVLVPTPYDEYDVQLNVTNKDNIITVSEFGISVKAVLKSVPKSFEKEAWAQFYSWCREQRPKPTKGRCMIKQSDGTYKECPKKNGNNRVACAECPNRGKLQRRDISKVSVEEQEEKNGAILPPSPAADSYIIEKENLIESKQRIIAKVDEMMDKSPKHCLAMLLMGLGFKGEEFAERMDRQHDAANRIRNQIICTAPDGITNFNQVDIQNFSANNVGDTEYYRAEAKKALDALMDMYFYSKGL